MLQLSEIKKIEAFSRADTVEQCRADLDAVEKQLVEMEAPLRELEDEITLKKRTGKSPSSDLSMAKTAREPNGLLPRSTMSSTSRKRLRRNRSVLL